MYIENSAQETKKAYTHTFEHHLLSLLQQLLQMQEWPEWYPQHTITTTSNVDAFNNFMTYKNFGLSLLSGSFCGGFSNQSNIGGVWMTWFDEMTLTALQREWINP